ncbi:MAG: ATP-binding protein, partial [Citrobacter portucalensis]
IKLDKSSITSSLIKSLAGISPIVLSGNGGVGKTAVIKDLYNLIKSTTPFFLFKATEFNNISNTNELVRQYGDFTFLDFVTAYNDTQEKCIVIDSAEKLSDLDDQTVFQEFLRLLIDNSWKIIFTTRRSYLDDLKYLLIGIYRVAFTSIDMTNISLNELDELAKKFSLTLPSDEHTKELICNPFYLNEYIQNQTGVNKDVSATDLKEVLWNKQIAKTFQRRNNMHIRRAEAFVEVAKRRAEQGSFLVKSNGIDADALGELANDEIVGYDSKLLGYFIAHDIY